MPKAKSDSIKPLVEHIKRVREQLKKKKQRLVEKLNPINEQLKALGESLEKLEAASMRGGDIQKPAPPQTVDARSSDSSPQTQISLPVEDAGSGYAVKLLDEVLEGGPLRFKDIVKRINEKYGKIPPSTLNAALLRNTDKYEVFGKKKKRMWRLSAK